MCERRNGKVESEKIEDQFQSFLHKDQQFNDMNMYVNRKLQASS